MRSRSSTASSTSGRSDSSPSSCISSCRVSASDRRSASDAQHLDVLGDPPELGGHLAGLVGVVPQVGRGRRLLELGPAFGQARRPPGSARLLEPGGQGADATRRCRPGRAPRPPDGGRPRPSQLAPWQSLNFLPLPHQHGSLRPIFSRSASPWAPGSRRRRAAGAAGPSCRAPRPPRRRPRSRPAWRGEGGGDAGIALDRVLGRHVAGLGQVGLGGGLLGRRPGRASRSAGSRRRCRPSSGRTSRSPPAARPPAGPAGPWPGG